MDFIEWVKLLEMCKYNKLNKYSRLEICAFFYSYFCYSTYPFIPIIRQLGGIIAGHREIIGETVYHNRISHVYVNVARAYK